MSNEKHVENIGAEMSRVPKTFLPIIGNPDVSGFKDLEHLNLRRLEMEEIDQLLISLEANPDDQTDHEIRILALVYYSLRSRRSLEAYALRERFIRLVHTVYWAGDYSMESLQRRLGVSPSFLSGGFSTLGLTARRRGERTKDAGHPSRIYTVTADALDDLSDPLVAYILGFLWADGRVLKKPLRRPEGVRVVVNPRDAEILNLLAKIFGSNSEIKDIQSCVHGVIYPGLQLTVYSQKLAERLAELGYTAREGGRGDVAPPSMPYDVELDFWRGLFDGDGHMVRDKRAKFPLGGWRLGISGSAPVIASFQEVVKRRLSMPVTRHINGRSQINFNGLVNGVRAPILAGVIYPRDKFALRRKYIIARALADAREAGLALGMREEQRNTRLQYTKKRPAWEKVQEILGPHLR